MCVIFSPALYVELSTLSERVLRAVRAGPRTLCAPFPYFQKYSIPGSGLRGAGAAGAALGYKQEAGGEQGMINLPTK